MVALGTRPDVMYSPSPACGTAPGFDLHSQILIHKAQLSFIWFLTVRASTPCLP